MKRLSSFGFVPSSPHSPTLPKRARGGQSELSTSSACASATVQPPQPPQVCVPQRSDVGTYSVESIRQLGNEERLWLYNNAFRPDPHHAFPAKEEYHGCAIRCREMVVFAFLLSFLLSVF